VFNKNVLDIIGGLREIGIPITVVKINPSLEMKAWLGQTEKDVEETRHK